MEQWGQVNRGVLLSFRAVIANNSALLSASEGRVIHVLLGEKMSTATAADVAVRAQTHESTVVRLAQKLGYRGYPDLRADLRRDEQSNEDRPTLMRGTSGYHLDEFIRDETAALSALSSFISQAELDSAAQTLHGSEKIYLLSSENERPTKDLLARRLRRLGLVVITLGTSPKDLAERFASFDNTSTLIAFAMREEPPQLATLLAEAAALGGKTIVLTDVPGHQFRPKPDHQLAARRGSDIEYRTQLVPIALCYALQLAVFHLDRDRYQAVRDAIDDRTRLLGGTHEIPLQP